MKENGKIIEGSVCLTHLSVGSAEFSVKAYEAILRQFIRSRIVERRVIYFSENDETAVEDARKWKHLHLEVCYFVVDQIWVSNMTDGVACSTGTTEIYHKRLFTDDLTPPYIIGAAGDVAKHAT